MTEIWKKDVIIVVRWIDIRFRRRKNVSDHAATTSALIKTLLTDK